MNTANPMVTIINTPANDPITAGNTTASPEPPMVVGATVAVDTVTVFAVVVGGAVKRNVNI